MTRTRYKFQGSFVSPAGVPHYRWEARAPGGRDSRVEQVTCPADWFWGNDEHHWVDELASGPEAWSIKQELSTEIAVAEIRGWSKAMRALVEGQERDLLKAAEYLGEVQTQWLGRRPGASTAS